MENLKKFLDSKLKKHLINGKLILDRFRVLDETNRKASSYNDSSYAPVYYYLGTYLKPKSMIEIGFQLGLLSGSFLIGCKTVENFFAFQEKTNEYYSLRVGKSNIKDHYRKKLELYYGSSSDNEFLKILNLNFYDFAIINEEASYDKYLHYLDIVWERMSYDGILAMENINKISAAKQAYSIFCKSKNRDVCIVKTRYGLGLIQK
jgi:predicted O-methyltransferase YrrM